MKEHHVFIVIVILALLIAWFMYKKEAMGLATNK